MSGGSWEYFFYKIQEVAEKLEGETCDHRNALGVLLNKCAKALHDIEWVDSGDYAPGDELEAIRACFDEIDVKKNSGLQIDDTQRQRSKAY